MSSSVAEDGNVVGNTYFTAYGAWQGRVRDRFFYHLFFQYFRLAPDGSETKLAVGEQTGVWVIPVAREKAILDNRPSKIMEGVLGEARERRPLAS